MSAAKLTRKQLTGIICLALAAITFLVYLPTLRHGFVNFDDPSYITENPNVQSGLTWHGLAWAFQIGYAAYWQPLTWISHMMDCQLFGLNPAGHHLINVLFHTANALLLFLLLKNLTGAMWRSALVAAFFAWHPLRVESVAWATERKDVLSGFFWMLTLLAYAKFVQKSETGSQKSGFRFPASGFYWLALASFACGLMSKPMIVTLPFVLLLLDFWPLQRFNTSTVQRLLVEKIPFFALALADSIVMSLAQKGNPSVWSLTELPMSFRIENAIVSYLRYVSKIFWPTDLALIYPYPHHWPLALVIAGATFLAVWTAFSLWRIKKNPYLAVGWFWFLGTLVPVIGIMQVGIQSMADRFSYLPSIGIFIAAVWGVNDLLDSRPQKIKIAAFAGSLALAGCLIVTSIQLKYWQDSLHIFWHTIKVTTDNYAADDCMGNALEDIGKNDEAEKFYAEAVRVEPDYPMAQFHFGMILLQRGDSDEASNHLAEAVQLAPHNPVMQFDFGTYLSQHGKRDEAANHFKTALAYKPDFPEAQKQLNQILQKTNAPARSTH
jgi:protein O-mannosyl-transferase